jgi:hypothetical protein
VPELQDAIKVVTDPANVVSATDIHTDVRPVRYQRALRALRDQGAGRAEARELIREAIQELGGRVESDVRASDRPVGPDTRTQVETFLVPAASIQSSKPAPRDAE